MENKNNRRILKKKNEKDKLTNTQIHPVYWISILGIENPQFIKANKYSHTFPELDNYIKQKMNDKNSDGKSIFDKLTEQKENLLQQYKDHKDFSNKLKDKILKQITWEKKEHEIRLSCEYLNISYSEPSLFEITTSNYVYNKKTETYADTNKTYKIPIKWRWPNTDESRAFSKPDWYLRWEQWINNDNIRRGKLYGSGLINQIENKKKFLMNEEIKKQWNLLTEQQRIDIRNSKETRTNEFNRKSSNGCNSYQVIDESNGYVIGCTASISYGSDQEYKTRGEAAEALKEFYRNS